MPSGVSLEQELKALEERLLSPLAESSGDLALLLADDFVEFGTSGRIFTRETTLQARRSGPPVARSLMDYKVVALADGVALCTYRAIRYGTPVPLYSLRCSIWKHIGGRWRMIFHQGTFVKREA
jgi:hypothetical protein